MQEDVGSYSIACYVMTYTYVYMYIYILYMYIYIYIYIYMFGSIGRRDEAEAPHGVEVLDGARGGHGKDWR